MTKEARRIQFDDFAADPSGVLEELARAQETALLEIDGRVFRLEAADTADAKAMPAHDPKRLRRILKRTAGAFKGLDRRRFLAEMHAQRTQSDTTPRP